MGIIQYGYERLGYKSNATVEKTACYVTFKLQSWQPQLNMFR
jgi:hypothetical protein